MTDKLTLYNLALGHLTERRLASLAEPREPRRVLDDFWPSVNGYCMERKIWNFALRAIQIDASSSVVPGFGFNFAFTIPSDWIRTLKVADEPSLTTPLNNFKEETGYWFANATPLFISYSSNDPLYGNNLGKWPASYEDYVALRLAHMACKRITGKDDLLKGKDGIIDQETKAYKICSANCSMNEAVGFPPTSSWIRARGGFGRSTAPGGDNPGSGLMS
jgi:hypothetical protein